MTVERGCGTIQRQGHWRHDWVPGALLLGGNSDRVQIGSAEDSSVMSDLLPWDSQAFSLAVVIP